MKKSKIHYTPKRRTEMWCYMDDDCVEIKRKTTYKLDSMSSYIWENCDGRVTIAEIIKGLSEKCSTLDSNIEINVLKILESWKCNDLLIMNFDSLHAGSEYDEDCIYHIEANIKPPLDILLLTAPSPSPLAHNIPQGNQMESLGIGYLSAFLNSHGFNAGVVDLWDKQLNPESIRNFISRYNPKIVGISSMSENFENGIKIAEIIKNISNDITILFGGSHVSFEDESALLNHKSVDVIVRGEGEHTVLELTNFFMHNIGELSTINGVTYQKNNKIIRTQDRKFIHDLDSLPFPDRMLPNKEVAVGIQTSRGCPGKCIFCSSKELAGGKYRKRTAENVIFEIEELLNRGNKIIYFQDDTLTADLKRLNEILDLIKKKNLNFKWTAFSRIDTLEKDPFIIKNMVNAGCIGLFFGIESGSQKMLDVLKKNLTVEQILNVLTNVCTLVKNEGIRIDCSFIIGHPSETHDTMLETFEFAKKLIKLGAMSFLSILCPFPGSSIFKEPDFYNLEIKDYDYSNYNLAIPVMDTKNLTAKEIRKYHYIYSKELRLLYKQHNMWKLIKQSNFHKDEEGLK